jgi:hypothetical protein
MLPGMEDPVWWRGRQPADEPRGDVDPGTLLTGALGQVPDRPLVPALGLRPTRLFRAEVTGALLRLDDLHLGVEWSTFEDCTFRQRVRPVLNEHGVAAQGSLGIGAALYRGCRFERVRFKTMGGYILGEARFEDCTFVSCRWDGHFAHAADLVGCTFVGRMNGCVWFGHDSGHDGERRNTIEGNDFTRTTFTDNVAWRAGFPLDQQRWPDGFTPVVDDEEPD